jgi:biopolymer transport protein ExbD
MSFGAFERPGKLQPMAEINVTPLVDVMLVLLVIFIITAPLLSYAIKLDLPNDPAPAAEPAPATISLSIDAQGTIHWDADAVTDDQLRARMASAAAGASVPEVHLRADKATRYERIAFVMSAAQQSGLTKIGFITEPATSADAPASR